MIRTIMRTSARCGGHSFSAMFFSFKSCNTCGCKCDNGSSCTMYSFADPLTPGVYLLSGSCALKPAVAPAPPCKLSEGELERCQTRQKTKNKVKNKVKNNYHIIVTIKTEQRDQK